MKEETKKKLWKINAILGAITGLMFLMLIYALFFAPENQRVKPEPKPKEVVMVTDTNAVVLCRSYYEDLYEKGTGYKAKIGIFSDYTIREMPETWVLKVWGECQNPYGAWMQIRAHCVVNKKPATEEVFDYNNISYFEFETGDK